MTPLLFSLALIAAPPTAPADDDEIILIDDDEAEESAAAPIAPSPMPATESATRLTLKSELFAASDLAHEPASAGPPEDFFEAGWRVGLRMQHRSSRSSTWRLALTHRLFHSTDHRDDGGRSKGVLLTEISEARLDWRPDRKNTFKIGLQRVDWGLTDGSGAGALFAPADLRFGLIGEPEDAQLPVHAVVFRRRLSSTYDSFLQIAWNPLYRPMQMRMWGGDWGMSAPNRPSALPTGDLAWAIDPSVEDRWQTNMMFLQQPELSLSDQSGAVRLSARIKGFELGVWGLRGFDQFPVSAIDPDVAWLIANMQRLSGMPQDQLLTEPGLFGRIDRLRNKTLEAQEAGSIEGMISARPKRITQFGAQVRRIVGPMVIAAESAWTPAFTGGRTLPDLSGGEPLRRATLYSVLQLEYQRAPSIVAMLQFSDFMVVDVANQPVFLLDAGLLDAEGNLDRPFHRDAAHLTTVTGMLRSRSLDDQLEVMVAASGHPSQGDYLLQPSVSWRFDDGRRSLGLGALIVGGPEGSMFGMFNHNDQIMVRLKAIH
jgi:hypothetical protein